MATSPCRFATSLSFARRGMFWRKPKQGEVARSSKALFCHSEHFLLSFQVLFFVIPSTSFLSFQTPARNPVWMLRCAQHDRMGTANLTLWSLSLQKERGWQPHPVALRRPSPCKRRGMFWRKPKQGEVARSSEHFFVIPSIFFCHSRTLFLSFRTQ